MTVFRMSLSRRFLLSSSVLAAAPALVPNALAETDAYPSKPIRIIVPFAPGGSGDITARLVGKYMEDKTGHRSSSRTSRAPTASSACWRSRQRQPTATP
ncbi:MAG TPA: hypothetical protein VEP47_14790 [Reyranella sp.]|nr:hypothetical protein [Reyranella sp.]